MDQYEPTPRTTLHRRSQRARYDRAFVHAVLDEAWVAHVAFVHEGAPVVLPMSFVRDGERIILHGARGNAMLRTLLAGGKAAVSVTHLDALVLAKSAMHHSMNYRSVVVFGTAHAIEEPEEKRAVLDRLVERMEPGRAAKVRPPSPAELDSTLVVAVPIEAASGKTRTGPRIDDPEDEALPVPTGLVPIAVVVAPLVPD